MAGSPWRARRAGEPEAPRRRSAWEVDLRDLDHQERKQGDGPDDEPVRVPAPEVEQPAPQGEQRSKVLMLRLTEVERDRLHELARSAGFGRTATWARLLLLSGGQRSGEAVARAELAPFRLELARIGNNLNQVARAVNIAEKAGGPVGRELAEELRRLTSEARRLREAIEAVAR